MLNPSAKKNLVQNYITVENGRSILGRSELGDMYLLPSHYIYIFNLPSNAFANYNSKTSLYYSKMPFHHVQARPTYPCPYIPGYDMGTNLLVRISVQMCRSNKKKDRTLFGYHHTPTTPILL